MHAAKLGFSYAYILLLVAPSNSLFAHETQKIYTQTTDKSLQEIIYDSEFAITERNLRITGRLHIGKTIQERGTPDFPDNEVILYCSVAMAQKMLELAPEYINFCPGRITIRSENDHFVVSAPLWPEETTDKELKQLLQKMNKFILEIIDYAVDTWHFTDIK